MSVVADGRTVAFSCSTGPFPFSASATPLALAACASEDGLEYPSDVSLGLEWMPQRYIAADLVVVATSVARPEEHTRAFEIS